jgi:amino acid adenylation domain-containing protein
VTIRSLQDYVARQAERRPESTAVVLNDESIDYGGLERRSNRLARLLKEGGCRPGDRVGLMLPKSPAAVVAMLATLKADCVYVPVDPESPALRVRRILGAADCRCVLASAQTAPLMGDLGFETEPWVLWMDSAPPPEGGIVPRLVETDADSLSGEPLPYARGDGQPAHMLFTSGSTGVPKGVVVAHTNVIAFVEWANGYFGLEEDDRVSCHSPLHFDLSTYDLYGAFAAGAEVYLVPPELNLFPRRLIDFIRSRRLTQWFSVPSILVYLARFNAVPAGETSLHLKRILWCGEVFPGPALKYWMERLPNVAFTNLYGPTEATIASSYYTVPASLPNNDWSVPIGKACGGEELLVLSEDLQPLPPCEVGEICIAGAGITLGYWRDEEKTNRAFVQVGGKRIYRTGDLGYRSEDGLVRFLGRADSQIKSRGHRIELGEIEAALYAVSEVAQGAVVAIEAPDFGGHVICCAYVARTDVEAPPRVVKERLMTLVPNYMLPTRWRGLDALPANVNGKVDRVALADMFRAELGGGGGHSAGNH